MHTVVLIHAPGDARVAPLRESLLSESRRLGVPLSFSDLDQIQDARRIPVVAVYLGSEAAVADPQCQATLQRALALHLAILPVIENRGLRQHQVPPQIQLIKALDWSGGPAPSELVRSVFHGLGITERERRVFISYRQLDGAQLAVAVHDALVKKGFGVFLDRFQTAVGEDIQGKIDEAIEDTAFMLLLYSPDMPHSTWVDWEVTRALKSRLPILVIRWTTAQIDMPKVTQANLPTLSFGPNLDFEPNGVVQHKLDEIVESVENWHADGLVRRRRETLLAARTLAQAKGWQVTEQPGWRLTLTRRGDPPTLLGVTPRLAKPEDLHQLDTWEPPSLEDDLVGLESRRVLLQASEELPRARRQFLNWVKNDRALLLALGENALDRIL